MVARTLVESDISLRILIYFTLNFSFYYKYTNTETVLHESCMQVGYNVEFWPFIFTVLFTTFASTPTTFFSFFSSNKIQLWLIYNQTHFMNEIKFSVCAKMNHKPKMKSHKFFIGSRHAFNCLSVLYSLHSQMKARHSLKKIPFPVCRFLLLNLKTRTVPSNLMNCYDHQYSSNRVPQRQIPEETFSHNKEEQDFPTSSTWRIRQILTQVLTNGQIFTNLSYC